MEEKFQSRTKEMLIEKLQSITPMALFFIAYLILFHILESYRVPSEYHVLHTPLDDQIPFCKFFIVPYVLWFFYVAFHVIYICYKEEAIYTPFSRMLFFGMSLFLLISAIFPNMQDLRPSVVGGQDIFSNLIRHLYETDTPTNIFPSIHVYNTLVIMIAIHKGSSPLFQNKIYKIMADGLGLAIVLSTMFLKQHCVLDVIGAVLLTGIAYSLFFPSSDSKKKTF